MNLQLLWSEVPQSQRYIFLIIFFASEYLSSQCHWERCDVALVPLPGAGHWPRKGVWGCAALKARVKTPFSRLSCRLQGSYFKQKSQFRVHKTPFWEILALTASIFTQILAHKPPNLEIFSSQAPKFGNFQLTSPQILKFFAHKPPFSDWGKCDQFEAPHPYLKKIECLPGCHYLRKPAWFSFVFFFQIIIWYFKRTTFKTTHAALADR